MAKRRRYVELFMGPLSLTQPLEDTLEACEAYYRLCKSYGYDHCIAAFETQKWHREYADLLQGVKRHGCADAVRVDITASRAGDALRIMRGARRLADLVALRGVTRQLVALASRDRRVDIVTFIPGISPPLYGGDMRYIEAKNGVVEIGIGGLATTAKNILSRQLAAAYRLAIKAGKRVDVAISVAGGTRYAPRDPRSLVEFGALFLELRRDSLREMLSTRILQVIERNREKNTGTIPVEGVRIEAGEEKIPGGNEAA